jgi:predicted GNAT superfamily acetyltransferase
VKPIAADSLDRALALNNDHAAELSLQSRDGFRQLVEAAFCAVWTDREEALLLAFDERAAYGSPNFAWFKARWARFVYIDRVVVRPSCRGQGHARALYDHLFGLAAAAGRDFVGCEVNADPPNAASDRFHEKLGFAVLGSADLGAKRVRYLGRRLGLAA